MNILFNAIAPLLVRIIYGAQLFCYMYYAIESAVRITKRKIKRPGDEAS